MSDSKPIAIVGISTELPSGSYSDKNLDYHTFFDFLLNKGQSYETIPKDRFDNERWHGVGLGHIISQKGSFLKDIPFFDHVEFGITAKEAKNMSLSTRKLIEHSFLALLDSGIDYRGRNIGCYMSATSFDMQGVAEPDELEANGSFAGYPYMVANKVSYHLDLRGPSIPVDTACSSSLTALHLAVQAIRAGDCDAAVLGGCQLNFRLVDFIQYSQGSVLSGDGVCKPLDESANGFSRGEGVTVVVVKSLDKAIHDNDHIYATILGTGINSSGSLAPVSAPVAFAQKEAMRRAFANISRIPTEIDYVELHATGTAAGDPTEANWVGEVFGQRQSELLVGSVKGNTGHLEICAFLASLCKICAMFETKLLPPTVNLSKPNTAIAWNRWNMRAPTEVTPIMGNKPQLLVSIASSGIGGSNGHAVLESFPERASSTLPAAHERPLLVLAGGLSPRSASEIGNSIDATWSTMAIEDLPAFSSASSRRGRQMPWQAFAIMSKHAAIIPFMKPTLVSKSTPRLAFVFSGQGPQYIHMGSQLFKSYPKFRGSILEMDIIYERRVGHSLRSLGLFSTGSTENWNIWPISITLPAIAMVQMATFDLLSNIGIVPSIVVGHSAGETAMMYASGACSREMALEISIARGTALATLEALGGSMVALNCAPDQAQLIIDELMANQTGILQIACYNSDFAVTLAGGELLLDLVVALARSRDISAHKLRTKIAVHSEFVEQCKYVYRQQVEDIFVRYPGDHVPMVTTYSSTFGKLWSQPFTPDYYWQNVRQPVLFSQSIKSIIKDCPDVAFVEISPHPVLSTYISDSGVEPDHVLCFMKRLKVPSPFSEALTLLQGVAKLSLIGYTEINFHSLNDTQPSAQDTSISYPFQRKYIPFCPESPKTTLFSRSSEWSGPLLHTGLRLNALTHPKLAEHVIMGEPILPAAGFLEMVFESGARLAWNVQFQSMLPLLSERLLPITFTVNGPSWSVSSELPPQSLSQQKQRIHASGFMSSDVILDAGKFSISDLKKSLQEVDISEFYEILAHFGQYGPIYQRVTACWKTNAEALVEIRAYDKDLEDLDKYVIHPALLDACFHAMVHPMFTANADRSVYYLPMSIETVALYDPLFIRKTLPKVVYCRISYRSWDPAGMTFDLSVTDTNGGVLCQLSGFRIARHNKTANALHFDNQAKFDGRFEIVYQPLLASTSYTSSGSGLLPSPSLGIAAQPNDLLASMEVHDTTGKELGESVEKILISLGVQGDRKVIRLLSIGMESLEIIRTSAESELQPQYILDIDVLVQPDSPLISPSSRGIRRIIYSPPSDSNAWEERNGTDVSFYDVILGSNGHEEGANNILEYAIQRLLPGGFVILTPKDLNNMEDTKHSSLSHTVLQRIHGFLPWFGPNSSHQRTTLDMSPISTEQCSSPSTSESPVKEQRIPTSIKPFHFDNALALRQTVEQLRNDETLWIESSQNTHGYAAIGFFRSLRKEMIAKDIRLALFDAKWSEEERTAMVSSLSLYPYIEREIFVDSLGVIRVPRLVPASTLRNFDTTRPDHSSLVNDPHLLQRYQVAGSQPPLYHAQVHVIGSSSEYGGLKAIVGCIMEPGTTGWDAGAHVIGVTSNPITDSNSVIVHEHSLMAFTHPEAYSPLMVSHCVITVFIAALAIGSKVLIQSDVLKRLRVVVTHNGSEDAISQSLSALLTLLDVAVVKAPKPLTPKTLDDIRSCGVVFTGWLERCDIDVITSVLPESATLLSWNLPQPGVSSLLTRNVWMVGDILHDTYVILHNFLDRQQKDNMCPPSRSSVDKRKNEVSTNNFLFDASKEYYLLGGLGSLGIRAAMWMYEHGARILVLTSRHGNPSFLTTFKDEMAMRILSYLQSRPDLLLRLEACDASSDLDMSTLFRQKNNPIGGCILMSVVLADKLFIAHDNTSYYTPFPGKVGALIALENAIDIHSLDFLVSISSAATFGNVGQTNYASANTAVDGLLSKYRNAFSLIAPAIMDSITISHGLNLLPDPRFKEWLPWSMTCAELFACLADGIRSLVTERFSLYIPRFDWHHMKEHLGNSPLYNHLIYEGTQNTEKASITSKKQLHTIIRKHLDVDESDFSADIPFTSYGLDSLSAGRLSHSLRPFLQISQLQLLADITLQDIERRIQEKEDLPSPLQQIASDREFNWQSLNQAGQTVVKLVKGEGIPLILIHGGGGNIVPFIPLQERFSTPLWAIQYTPDCPTDSLQAMATFYFLQIKASRPSGPYRLGAYCACSLLAFEVAYLLRDSGDRVIQLVILDHFPTLYSSPIFPLDDETIQTKRASESLITIMMDSLLSAISRDPTTASFHRIAAEIRRARQGETVSQFVQNYVTFMHQFITMSAKFLMELCDIKAAEDVDPLEMNRRLRDWTMQLDFPLTVVVAENGFFKCIPQPNDLWTDLTWTGGNVVHVPGAAHLNMMESSILIEALENGWHEFDVEK